MRGTYACLARESGERQRLVRMGVDVGTNALGQREMGVGTARVIVSMKSSSLGTHVQWGQEGNTSYPNRVQLGTARAGLDDGL
jgi:hypothetical protein